MAVAIVIVVVGGFVCVSILHVQRLVDVQMGVYPRIQLEGLQSLVFPHCSATAAAEKKKHAI